MTGIKKPMSSGRIINFTSNQPPAQKINTATNLINKILNNSHKKFYQANINRIHNIFHKNSYPKHLINNLIEKATNNSTSNNKNSPKTNTQQEPQRQFLSVPYIKNLTENKNIRRIIKNDQLTFAHKPNFTLKSIFTKTKTRIKTEHANMLRQ